MVVKVMEWDWRAQPDLDELGKAIRELSGGTLELQEVATGSDSYALVVADQPLTEQDAADAWAARYSS
jgi:hypothetical protein